MRVSLLNGVFLMTDDRGALLAIVDLSSLLELHEERLRELTKDSLHHVLFREGPGVDVSVRHVAELRLLTKDYVIISEESFGLESVGQVVVLGFDSVIENMSLNYLETDAYFSSLDEVHLLYLLTFLIDYVSVISG